MKPRALSTRNYTCVSEDPEGLAEEEASMGPEEGDKLAEGERR